MAKLLFRVKIEVVAVKKFLIIIMTIVFVSGCSGDNERLNENEASEAVARQAEVLVTDLDIPWNITKNNNTFYLSQRAGNIIKVNGENGSKTIQEVDVTKDVSHVGEGGLLGFILSPDFESTQKAFAYHTYQQNGEVFNRIVVLQLIQDRWKETSILLEGIPGGRIHNGGRIKIGPDDMLYATAGDAGNPDHAQNISSLAGKILRMELDGSIPEDNPITNSYVYSYGHRNPQGLAWDNRGKLYSSEHGQSAHDEINQIDVGKNYGWPVIEGDEKASNMVSPLFQTGEETWAPSGIEIHNGNIYVATLRGESIRVVNLSGTEVDTVFEGAGRLRDIFIEDQSLYSITNNRDGRGNPREGDDRLFRLPITK